MLKNEIESLKLPELLRFEDGEKVKTKSDWEKRRLEILKILSEEVYGRRPDDPKALYAMTTKLEENQCAGKVREEHLILSSSLEDSVFSFPIKFFLPKSISKPMTIVYISFDSDGPSRYLPIEEITDEGFALATFNYNDVAFDGDDDFIAGLAGLLKKEEAGGQRTGKIMMWAWAASRVLDYLLKRDDIDHKNIAVMGHSRLGKAALLAAAYDERFAFCFPNNSGCSGDAITRDKEGERVKDITDTFPYWFAPNYKKYAGREEDMPFDQHFLLAAIAPRYISGGVAIEDTWAGPKSQYLSYVAADEVYKFLDSKGFLYPDRYPLVGDVFHDGELGFHMRSGQHFLSRYDWIQYMNFMKKHRI